MKTAISIFDIKVRKGKASRVSAVHKTAKKPNRSQQKQAFKKETW